MSKQQPLEAAIEAAQHQLALPRRDYLQSVMISGDGCIVSRTHLEALIAAATWRLGYLAAKEEK